jgi:transcriptional regulator with XRE-family HTH domain
MTDGTTFFGQWLRQRRRSLDLTQTELATLIGCSVVSIRKLEMGERRPSRDMASQLADKLGIADEERVAFIHFARTNQEPEMFRHPLFAEPAASLSLAVNGEDLVAPEMLFPGDSPGWVRVASDVDSALPPNKLVVARYHSAPIDSPHVIALQDRRNLCKIRSSGRVVGGLKGIIHQEITQIHPAPHQTGSVIHSAVQFEIETEVGTIKGSCNGFMTWKQDGSDEHSEVHGKIYDIAEPYVDLFLAEVSIESRVVMASNGIKDYGILKILPR